MYLTETSLTADPLLFTELLTVMSLKKIYMLKRLH